MRRRRWATGAVLMTALAVMSCTSTTDGTGIAASGLPMPSASSSTSSSTAGPTASPTVSAGSSPYTLPELSAAKTITGVQYKPEPDHTHTTGTVTYDTSPPTGGDHNPIWALCDGVVYDHQIANENAVHMLEHGAVWITYNPDTLPAAALTILKTRVDGVNYLALSPYAGLKTPISLQAWNYQLFLSSPTDLRISQFIDVLKNPSSNTPEPGAGCTGSGFIAAQSTPGHPYNG